MSAVASNSSARSGGSPLFSVLAPVSMLCFAAALVTDVVYWGTAGVTWSRASIWLITAGLIVAAPTILAGMVGLVRRNVLGIGVAWPAFLGFLLGSVLALVNAFVHSRDGYTAIVPTGLILSTAVVMILLLTIFARVRTDRLAQTSRSNAWTAFITSCVAFVAGIGSVFTFSGTDQTFADPSRQIGADPTLPGLHHYLLPPMQIAPASHWSAGETPTVAGGLKVQALATGLMHPRSLCVLPNGDVLVVESNGPKAPIHRPKDVIMGWVQSFAGTHAPGGNRVTLIRPAAADHPALRTVFLDHLNSPFGITLVGGHHLYVANTDALMHYDYADGQTAITTPGSKVTDLPGGPIDHHWTKSLLASPDGTKLYVGVGSNSNITENGMEAEAGRAAVWEIDRATGAKRIFASGLRNPTGLNWEPETHALWAVVNERDELGPNLVPDYLTSVKDGGFYGWPYSYYGQHVDPRVAPQRPDLVARAIPPDYALSSHVAPLGVVFYTAAGGLPASYRGGAFVGEHGSWDRSPLSGYKVVFVPFSGGKPSGPPQDVVTGFLTQDDHARGRPVGLAVDQSGALLVADDLGNTVWRVSAGS